MDDPNWALDSGRHANAPKPPKLQAKSNRISKQGENRLEPDLIQNSTAPGDEIFVRQQGTATGKRQTVLQERGAPESQLFEPPRLANATVNGSTAQNWHETHNTRRLRSTSAAQSEWCRKLKKGQVSAFGIWPFQHPRVRSTDTFHAEYGALAPIRC
jgi:hypothetical protein